MRTASFRDNAGLNTGPKQLYRLLWGNQGDSSSSVKITPPRSGVLGWGLGGVDAQTGAYNISSYYLWMPTVAQKMTL